MSGPGLPLEDSAEELYEHAPCGYVSTLPDGTIVRVNETFLQWTGFARDELVDRMRFQELLTAGGRIFHETHVAPMLRMQGAVRELALELDCPAGQLPVLLNAVAKTDESGNQLLTRITVLDATERRGYERELLAARDAERVARERTERLQRVTAGLASALDARLVATVVVEELVAGTGADRAVVALLGEGEPQLVGFHGPGLVLPVVDEPVFEETRADDPGALAVLPALAGDRALGVIGLGWPEARAFPAGERTYLCAVAAQCGQALERALLHEATLQAARTSALLARAGAALEAHRSVAHRAQAFVEVLVDELADAARLELVLDDRRRRWQAGDAELLAAGADGGEPQQAEVPLPARGGLAGKLLLVRHAGRAWRAEHEPLLEELADRASLALENARLAEHERDVAHALQRSVLEGSPPHDARLGVAALYRPAVVGLEVGGDWHDAFRLDADRIAVVLGDVVGRGVQAASAMGQLRSAVRALAVAGLGPAALLERLDAFVEHVPSARMATVAYGELDLASGRLRLACAGHPPPLVTGPAGPRYLWGGRSAPLGAYLRRAVRGECEVQLGAGDRLLLYSDGLVERRDRPLDTGLAALAVAFGRTAGRPLEEVAPAVADTLLAGTTAHDDVCALCVAFGVTEQFERHVAADPEALASLRRDLRTWLAGNDVPPDDRDAVVLACGEAVANSIEHGYGADRRGVVAVQGRVRGPELELAVADEGAWRPPHGLHGRGRGLLIIGKLMDEVSVSRVGGTTVHMRRALRRRGVG